MHSWIIVVDHPYHAVTDANGKFTPGAILIPPALLVVADLRIIENLA
jgi:hypothetical protein